MASTTFNKIRSVLQLYELIPEHKRIMVDILRQIIKATLPASFGEKISFNVPYFYGNRGICLIWPATVPRGGIKNGVLLWFWYGHKLADTDHYLTQGTNKRIFYRIFNSIDEIETKPIEKLLNEAIKLDRKGNSMGSSVID